MPELPEVEIYREKIESDGLNRRITGVKVLDKALLDDLSEKKLQQTLKDHSFTKVKRLGKYLGIELSSGGCLEVHFGMTGSFSFYDKGQRPEYSKVIFDLESGENLSYIDPRKFGHLALRNNIEEIRDKHDLGPDALSIGKKDFVQHLQSSGAMVKSALMNQSLLSGIGNVYADEILFQSRIHPQTKSSDLSKEALEKMYREMKKVLDTSIKYMRHKLHKSAYGKARKSLPDSYILSNRKPHASCPDSCQGKLKTIKVSGRTTYYCPDCQKKQ